MFRIISQINERINEATKHYDIFLLNEDQHIFSTAPKHVTNTRNSNSCVVAKPIRCENGRKGNGRRNNSMKILIANRLLFGTAAHY